MGENRSFNCTIVQRLIPQATARTLTLQLRELERDQLVHREVYPVVPPKTEYSLTELGRTLIPLITELREWGRYYFEYTHQPNPCQPEEEGAEKAPAGVISGEKQQ